MEKLDCALVESTRFTLARRFFPQLDVAFNVASLSTTPARGTIDKKRILDAAGSVLERIRKDGTLKRLIDRYYGHAMRISAVDAGAFIEQIVTALPKLKPHFLEAEMASGVDWRLVAAIGYQESHWDRRRLRPRACAAS
jgi:membrane-bound lytic murein transglycosylase F